MVASNAGIEDHLRAIVGPSRVRTAGEGDGAGGVVPHLVVEPGSDAEVAAVLRCADDAGLTVIPRGGGTKLDWGNPPRAVDLVLSLARLNRVVEHAWADMTVTVQAGCTVAELQNTLAQHGQRLAIDVLWPERATVGGILSTNDSGTLRLRYGGLRDLVIGSTLALTDGTMAASGGKVVKNVAGYDLSKLATGALGTLGVITQATFRLHPLPRHTRSLSITASSIGEAQRLTNALQQAPLSLAALQIRAQDNEATQIDLLFEGTEAGITSQEEHVRGVAEGLPVASPTGSVWEARQQLWLAAADGTAIAKFSVLPADLGSTLTSVAQLCTGHAARWRVVAQATGLGWLRLDVSPPEQTPILGELRARIEQAGGSLTILQQPPGAISLDTWGSVGDALPLMRAVKQQLDPRGTLNPGRFVV
jgi:glycolate oxidase FAD binding subunit